MPRDKPMNENPFSHYSARGTYFEADRCDFRGGITVYKRPGASMEDVAADIGELMGWHAVNIRPELNGFAGYDAIKYTFLERE